MITSLEKSDELDQQEDNLRKQVRELPDEQRKAYFKLLNKRLKDPDTYATLAWSLPVALHHLYMKQYKIAAVVITTLLVAINFIYFQPYPFDMIGIGLIVVLFILEFFELIRSQLIVKKYNNQMMEQTLAEIKESTRISLRKS
ncbi:TM2 domain-containing protein [Magnetococcales bacterium HHB-1]